MPTISMFYGILVLMYFRDNQRHHSPHIHARYQGSEGVIALADGALLDGKLPPRELKLVQAWVEIHRDELIVDWDLAVQGEPPFRIAPLQWEVPVLVDVTAVEVLPDHHVLLHYANGERRVFDMRPLLELKPWTALQSLVRFAQVRVEYGTLVWPGDIDVAPETLYDLSQPVTPAVAA